MRDLGAVIVHVNVLKGTCARPRTRSNRDVARAGPISDVVGNRRGRCSEKVVCILVAIDLVGVGVAFVEQYPIG